MQCCVASFLLMFSATCWAQDDAQAFINNLPTHRGNNRAGDGVDIMDLSTISAKERKTTLEITNGRRIRIINGTFTRHSSLDGPIIHLANGSYLEIGDAAGVDAYESSSRREAILMEGAELKVLSNGKLQGHKYTSNDLNYDFMTTPFAAVLMTSDNDKFTTEDGSQIFNTVVCEAKNASVNYNGGTMTQDDHLDNFRSASDINLLGFYPLSGFQLTLTEKKNVVVAPSNYDWLCNLSIAAPKKVDNDILIKNCHSYFLKNDPSFWEERVHWTGDLKYQTYAEYGDNTIRLSFDDAQDWVNSWPRPKPDNPEEEWHCGCVISWNPLVVDPYPWHVPCKGSKMKKDLEIPDDDAQWWIDGRKQEYEDTYDCEGEVDQGEHDIYIRPHATLWWRWLRWRGCSCQGKHIWVWGTLRIYRVWYDYYWRFIHVMPGGKVEIEDMNGNCEETVIHVEGGEVNYGGDNSHCTGGMYGWYCTGGTIYIRGGWLSGGTSGGWTGTSGNSYHYGGTVHGGIHNYGWHYWHAGYCTGGGDYNIYNHKGGHFYYYGGTCGDSGTGKIWNEGDLYIDGGGSVSCGDIYCVRGGCIYILKKLTFTLRLIFTVENIVPGETVVVGDDEYKLTKDDIDRIQISLPDGYEWKYDSSCGCITIHETTGISYCKGEDNTVVKTYDVLGRQTMENTKGLNIQKMNDGSVKKTIVK